MVETPVLYKSCFWLTWEGVVVLKSITFFITTVCTCLPNVQQRRTQSILLRFSWYVAFSQISRLYVFGIMFLFFILRGQCIEQSIILMTMNIRPRCFYCYLCYVRCDLSHNNIGCSEYFIVRQSNILSSWFEKRTNYNCQ